MSDSQGLLWLLSFDGGGIRGLSSLYLLRSIMQSLELEKGLRADEHLLPCDIFDVIAGTSTGGLIAVMLGILRMDAQTCIDEYIKLAPKIFPLDGFVSRRSFVKVLKLLLGRYRFDSLPLEQEIKDLVSTRFKDTKSEGRGVYMRSASAPDKCKVFVCANTEKYVKLTLFRNYHAPWDDSDDCAIWEACRATSAAPTFFPPISIGNPPVSYIDGGLGHNNPIRSVFDEAKQLWPSRKIGCIVSIGTGIPALVDSGKSLKLLVETLKAISTEAEKTARQVLQEMENTYGNHQNIYYRFNVQRGLEGVGLDEWEKIERVVVATREYLNNERSKIQKCVSQVLKPSEVLSKEQPQFQIPFSLRSVPIIGYFVPRVKELEEIESCLIQSPIVNRRKVFTLYGLGGIGKTQLALEFARTYKDHFSATFWLHGDNLESLKLSLAEGASRIRTKSKSNEHVGANDAAESVDVLSRETLDWLSQQNNNRWLLIYDNCDTLSDEEGGYDLLSMFPEADHGSIIITTRRNQLSSLGNSQKLLGKMNETQSVALLENNINQGFIMDETSSWDRKWFLLLANTLDGLPLALVQAARYIRMTGIDIPGYLDLYENSWADLAEQMPDVRDYRYGSVQRTWAISFDEIKRQNLKALNLLQLISRFDCHDIWTDLIINGNQGSDTPKWFQDVCKSKVYLLATLGLLFDFCLLQKGSKADSFSMHPVVHQCVAMSTKGNLGEYIKIAVVAIAVTAPLDHESGFWAIQIRLILHADKVYGFASGLSYIDINWQWREALVSSNAGDLTARAVQQDWTDNQMEHPLRKLGWLYFEQQFLEKARYILQFGMETVQNIHGEEDPLVLRFGYCLAHVYNALMDLEKAESLAVTASQGYQKYFGEDSKWNINALACLAQTCNYRKDYKRAIELGETILSILRKNPDAWADILSYHLNNLSIFYSNNGQLHEAIEMNLESLKLKFDNLDSDDPFILDGLENLAGRYMEAGSYTESERLLKQCIEGNQKVFGVKSTQATAVQDFLGHLYWKSGRLAEAEKMYKIAIDNYENALGANHEDTARSVSNLCLMIYLQWEKACPFVIDGLEAGPLKTVDSSSCQQLIELCRILYKYPGQIESLSYPAKMLFRYCSVDESKILLQGQATLENGSWSYSDRTCDAIDNKHMLGTERFVCMICSDLDLCRDCMAIYKGQKLPDGDCIEHPFLDVSIPSLTQSVDFVKEAKKTLIKIFENHSNTEAPALKAFTTEGSNIEESTSGLKQQGKKLRKLYRSSSVTKLHNLFDR